LEVTTQKNQSSVVDSMRTTIHDPSAYIRPYVGFTMPVQRFIDIRLLPGIATPFMAVPARCSLHVRASLPLRLNVTSSTKLEVRSATPPEEDRATATGDLRPKFREDRSSGSRDMLTDRQTDRQTGRERFIFHNTEKYMKD